MRYPHVGGILRQSIFTSLHQVEEQTGDRGAAPESKATTTTCSMSWAKVSCAFVMRRGARADFTGEYRFAVGLKRCCWLQIPVMLFDAPDGLRVSDVNHVRITEIKSSRPVIRETAGPRASRPPLEPALVT
jgi:hypothetical protein